MQSHIAAAVACLLLLQPLAAWPQAADPDPMRFAEAIGRFEQWDRQNAFPPGGVVFVGSSSIAGWQTAERFPRLPVINRGFGGAHVSDVNHFIGQTVLRYDPKLVVFYAGNNDIAAGKSASQVLADYRAFVERVQAHAPMTPILFISIHPSPLRWEYWPEMQWTNALIKSWSADRPELYYADIATPMLAATGEPRAELYVEDGLHLSEAGYDLWTSIVSQAIAEIQAANSASPHGAECFGSTL
jgi:lysophospholipase L1-like esterase